MNRAFVGLGSNLGDRAAHLETARRGIAAIPRTRVIQVSSLYETEPVGDPGQPRFLNAVILVETGLSPESLLAELLRVELGQGRHRDDRVGPRAIDLLCDPLGGWSSGPPPSVFFSNRDEPVTLDRPGGIQ